MKILEQPALTPIFLVFVKVLLVYPSCLFVLECAARTRVLEDVFGLENVFEDTF